jgi:hypothetical protein
VHGHAERRNPSPRRGRRPTRPALLASSPRRPRQLLLPRIEAGGRGAGGRGPQSRRASRTRPAVGARGRQRRAPGNNSMATKRRGATSRLPHLRRQRAGRLPSLRWPMRWWPGRGRRSRGGGLEEERRCRATASSRRSGGPGTRLPLHRPLPPPTVLCSTSRCSMAA